jgi:hypothetical protein
LQPESTEATRYLCAAVHLDEAFGRAALDEVLYQPHQAVAPSHGISLGPVLRHALAARRRSLVRDGVVAGVLILGLAISFAAGLLVLLLLVGIWLIMRIPRLVAARRTTAAVVYLIIVLFVVPPLVILLISSSMLPYWLSGMFYYGFPDGDVAPSRGPVWLLLLLLIWATYFVHRLMVHHTIAAELTPEFYDAGRAPSAGPIQERHLRYIEQAQQGNLTVYSQDTGARPFIGFGAVVQEWSLVTPLRPAGSSVPRIAAPLADDDSTTIRAAAADGAAAIPFTIDQLYEAIRTGMAALSDPRFAADEVIPHLSVRDRVFLAGRLPINSPFLDHGYPRSRVSEAEIKDVQRTPRGRFRHYQSVRMAAWDGELEVTTFVHAAHRGRMLFVEFVATVMPGIKPAYHRIDTYDRLDGAAILGAAGRAVRDVIRSPLVLLAVAEAGVDRIRRALNESSNRQRISRQLMFDYGCRSSVRELAADFVDPMRFQLYDADERVRLVRRRLLQIVVGFLEQHRYDVTELADQAATIINNTRINQDISGSTFYNSPVVAGNSASVSVGNAQSAATSPAAGRSGQGGPV